MTNINSVKKMEDLMNELSMSKKASSIITVIGVGGAGGNALDHMWRMGIKDVNFLACNTDARALENLSIPIDDKIVMGPGLGAGNDPEQGRKFAMEALDQIREYLVSHNTEMVFIAAGMGGGTGTGASPVIAKLAHEMDLLTVANVTSPLLWEGPSRSEQARQGIEELRKYVDSLLVIDNESIIEQFGNLPMTKAFGKADDILASATKGIAELITVESAFIRVDFADLKRVMKGSGRAHMGVASAEGENRAKEAARKSLCSPLLNSNLISGAKKILLSISAANVDDISYKEAMEVLQYIQSYASRKDEDGVHSQADIIWGASQKPLPDGVLEVVVVATGFDHDQQELSRPQALAPVLPDVEIEHEERIPQLQPAQHVERQTAAMPAVLDRKKSKYDHLEDELRVPSYKRRNMELVVHHDSSPRRKEIVRDDQGDQNVVASDNKLFNV